ncbi:DUF6470 family protein [Bacillaceae bacterium S4-13-56]
MKLPQVRLESQMAQIQIQLTSASQTTQQPNTTQTIRQPEAEIRIEKTPSKLTIDQTQAWNDMDLKSVKKRIEDAAQLGKQKVMEGVARRVRQGEELMEIENGGNVLQRQASENGHRPEKQFNIGWIPSHFSVRIDYQPSKVNINVKTQQPIIENRASKPIINYQPGSIETSLKQQANLEIDFENLAFRGPNFEMPL